MSEFFKGIGKISFEGKDSKNPLAFKHYNPDEVIGGKTMKEQLKFALSWWHTMGGDGTDMFGCGTTDKTWGEDDSAARAKAKVDAAFEIMDKLSIDYFCFHDRDLSPEYGSLSETNAKLDEITDYIAEKMKADTSKKGPPTRPSRPSTGPSLFLLKKFYPEINPADCLLKDFPQASVLPIPGRGRVATEVLMRSALSLSSDVESLNISVMISRALR